MPRRPSLTRTRPSAPLVALAVLALIILGASHRGVPGLPRIDHNDPSSIVRHVAALAERRSWVLHHSELSHWRDQVQRALERVADDPAALDAALGVLIGSIGDQHSLYQSPSEAQREAALYGERLCPPPRHSQQAVAELLGRYQRASAAGVSVEPLTPDVTLIRVSHFTSPGITSVVHQALQGVRDAPGPHAVVLDLRANPGGSIRYMSDLAALFQYGTLWRLERRGWPTLPFGSFFVRPVSDAPLVIVVDRGTQSAAEALAGALQRAERAVVVGETTAGNTDMITPYCLPTGGIVWIADGLLQPRDGPSWYAVGVTPDVHAPYPDSITTALQIAHNLNLLHAPD